MNLTIFYRGPLSSCNYGCDYCPFAKHTETDAEHAEDAAALERFVCWVAEQGDDRLSVFFTPWGEALIRKRYQEAIVRLTHLPQVDQVAIQTNLSCRLDWVERCDKSKLGIWTTYHPSQTPRPRFIEKCRELDSRAVRFSVGVVGLRDHFDEIGALREELSPSTYLWVNAYKRQQEYYSAGDVERLTGIDHLFPINNQRYPSLGKACRCGETVVSVDGEGTMRRCHFIPEPIGNIYDAGWRTSLRPTPCTNDTCGCHIGYVHMQALGLYDVFQDGVLARIPRSKR